MTNKIFSSKNINLHSKKMDLDIFGYFRFNENNFVCLCLCLISSAECSFRFEYPNKKTAGGNVKILFSIPDWFNPQTQNLQTGRADCIYRKKPHT